MARRSVHGTLAGGRTALWAQLGPALVAAVVLAGPGPAAAAPSEPVLERTGPLWARRASRKLVRGDRPADRGAHARWEPPVHDPEAGHRAALESFERAAMPERRTRPLDGPPPGWMASLRTGDLPVRWNDKTVRYLTYFRDTTRGRTLMRGWMTRAARYEKLVRGILRHHGLPEDLMMVALAESGFRTDVRSRVGAAGLWQFMASTARVYGLRIDFWVDERLDPVRSTHAAAAFLADLRARFGSWELALAAYNAGYGVVMTSMARHNTNNFWTLAAMESGLPYATTQYVPKIMAAAIVGRNRRTFGVAGDQIDAPPAVRWAEIEVPPGTPLSEVAKAGGVDAETLHEWNAQFYRGRTPPGRRSKVRVPASARGRIEAALDRFAAEAARRATHRVRSGESLARIARAYGTTERKLRALNGIEDGAEVQPGTVLFVPKGRGKKDATDARPLVAAPPLALAPGERLVFFEVTRGATPNEIAAVFGIPWEHIAAWNDLDPRATLPTGLWLQVLVAEDFDPSAAGVVVLERDEVELVVRGSRAHLEAELARRGLVRRGYRVRRRDDVAKVARKFGLSASDVARINGISRTARLRPGQVLVVYVPKGKARGTIAAPEPPALYGPPER
ncbi:MAG: LysM peptidoglycan-binding domain-containing protein, partial [Deltaproteobacteria bacterium]